MLLYYALVCVIVEDNVSRAINHELSAYGFSAVLQKILNSNLFNTVAVYRCERICFMGLIALGEGKQQSRC